MVQTTGGYDSHREAAHVHCGSCGASWHDDAVDGTCPLCDAPRLHADRFLLLEPLGDGSLAVDLEAGERVRLWQARRFVPEGVETVGSLWVSNTASEARVLEAMEPLEDLFGWERPPELPTHRPRRLESSRRRGWRMARPFVMAAMMLSLVPLGLAASPPPPDYAHEAAAPDAFAPLLEEVRAAPEIQACLETYRERVRLQDVAYPALLVVQGNPTPSLRPRIAGRSGDAELTGCLVSAARRLPFPTGGYTVSVPVGEEPLP